MHRIAIIAYTARPDAVKWATHAAERLIEEGVKVFLEDGLAEVLPEQITSQCETCAATDFEKYAELVISFGGDGTLLGAAHVLIGSDVPIMGVNVGKLGFLAEFPVTLIDDAIMEILKGNYRVVDRSTLHITVGGAEFHALNEVVIERAVEAKMIEVRTTVDQHHVADYRADGVIVTTPTGSTAYSLAVGGPIIAPSANVLCITPISPHTLTLRPLIINDTNEVRFTLPSDSSEAHVVADGRIVATLKAGEEVLVKKSDHMVKLIKRADNTYYDLLREKLLWSADATRK
jgi:NAD+ kinase